MFLSIPPAPTQRTGACEHGHGERRPLTVVLTNDARIIAGGEQYVLHLAEGLRRNGHTVLLAPLPHSELAAASRERGFETVEIAYASGGRELAGAARLARALRGRPVDIIHSNSYRDRTIGAMAARVLGIRSVASIHSCLSIRRNLTHWARNRWLIDRFTPVGYSTKRIMVEQDRIPAARINVVHIGIPDCGIGISDATRSAVRAEFGIADNELLLGNVSNLFPFKGHSGLLRALPALLARAPHVKLVIAGDGELRDPLEAEAAALGLSASVRFLGRRGDVSRLLSALDGYVQPSRDHGGETFPVSILEAMACGLPVVGSDVGDIAHMIDDGVSGLLVPPDDIDALSAGLTRIALDPALRASMAAASRARFLERFTLDAMVRNIEAEYYSLLGA